jgi:hypothetical protein
LIETDWLELWKELAASVPQSSNREMVSRFKNHAQKRSERPDSLLDFIIDNIDCETTVIDVGAGSGRWTIPLAQKARSITAVEPSEDMRKVLEESISNSGVKNVRIIRNSWEEAAPEPHDIVVCAHAMYSSPDLASFVRKMEKYSAKACYMAVRLPPADGIIGELCLKKYGHRHDSPNAIIAYNALYSLGVYPNILMETGDTYQWTNNSFEEAFIRAKRHLKLESNTVYDALIRQTLDRRLIRSNDTFIWPDGMRSALLYWTPGKTA